MKTIFATCLALALTIGAQGQTETTPNIQRMTYAKLLKHRNNVYGNRQYAKNPFFHVGDINGRTLSLGGSINHMTVIELGGQQFAYADGRPLLTKAHVYQPLEKK